MNPSGKITNILNGYKNCSLTLEEAAGMIEQPMWDIWNGLVNGDYGIGKLQSDAVDPIQVSDAISKAMGWMDEEDDVQEPKEVTDVT